MSPTVAAPAASVAALPPSQLLAALDLYAAVVAGTSQALRSARTPSRMS